MSTETPIPPQPFSGETWPAYVERAYAALAPEPDRAYVDRCRKAYAFFAPTPGTPPAFGEPGWAPDPAVFGLGLAVTHAFAGRLDRPCDRCGLPDRAACHVQAETVAAEPEPTDAVTMTLTPWTAEDEAQYGEAVRRHRAEHAPAAPLPTLPPSHVGAMLRGLRADLRALDPEVEFTVERFVGGEFGEIVHVRWRAPDPAGGAPSRCTLGYALAPYAAANEAQRRDIVERVRKGMARYGAMRETPTVERVGAFTQRDVDLCYALAGLGVILPAAQQHLRQLAARIERTLSPDGAA